MTPYEKVYDSFIQTIDFVNKGFADRKYGVDDYKQLIELVTKGYAEVLKQL